MAGEFVGPTAAFAQPGAAKKASTGLATRLSLGMTPDPDAAGAVVVLTDWGTFVTFRALVRDEDGAQWPGGTAVIELVGCRARTFSYSTDLGQDGRPYSFFELPPGEVYEVADSPWLLRAEEDSWLAPAAADGISGRRPLNSSRRRLRHYVFTFGETTFQCVAEGLKTQIRTAPFGKIAADLEWGD